MLSVPPTVSDDILRIHPEPSILPQKTVLTYDQCSELIHITVVEIKFRYSFKLLINLKCRISQFGPELQVRAFLELHSYECFACSYTFYMAFV